MLLDNILFLIGSYPQKSDYMYVKIKSYNPFYITINSASTEA